MNAEIVLWGDVVCPWATVIVLRLREARARAGAEDALDIVHRALPLELEHAMAIPRRVVDAEIPLCAALTPDFGWSLWQGRAEEYPSTVLLPIEAVQAASAQSAAAGEQLDLELRRAFFARSRSIGLRHEVLAAAAACPSVDLARLTDDLDHGRFRGRVTADFAEARAAGIPCSGTVVHADGTRDCNPGTEVAWVGRGFPRGTPALRSDDPSVYDRIVAEALAADVVLAG